MSEFNSQKIERSVLSGLIKFPHLHGFSLEFLNESSFEIFDHKSIYKAFCDISKNGRLPSAESISLFLSKNNISSKNSIDFNEYVESLSFSSINEDGAKEVINELFEYNAKKTLKSKITNLASFILAHPIEESFKELAAIYRSKNSIIKKDPSLFQSHGKAINDFKNGILLENSIKTCSENFNNKVGGLSPGVYGFFCLDNSYVKFKNQLCWDISQSHKTVLIDTLDESDLILNLMYNFFNTNFGVSDIEFGKIPGDGQYQKFHSELKKRTIFSKKFSEKGIDILERWFAKNVDSKERWLSILDFEDFNNLNQYKEISSFCKKTKNSLLIFFRGCPKDIRSHDFAGYLDFSSIIEKDCLVNTKYKKIQIPNFPLYG